MNETTESIAPDRLVSPGGLAEIPGFATLAEALTQKSREVVYLKLALEVVGELARNNPQILETVRYATRMSGLETGDGRHPDHWNFR